MRYIVGMSTPHAHRWVEIDNYGLPTGFFACDIDVECENGVIGDWVWEDDLPEGASVISIFNS